MLENTVTCTENTTREDVYLSKCNQLMFGEDYQRNKEEKYILFT